MVLVPERGSRGGQAIPLGAQTQLSIARFVSAVSDRIGSWGMAGNGMYWRPVLEVSVAPGAEPRFRDLQVLLEDSGLVVEQKQ